MRAAGADAMSEHEVNERGLRVECEALAGTEPCPRAFWLGARRIAARCIIDRWLAPDHRYFKLKAEDGGVYILRHDVPQGRWELVLFDSSERAETRLSSD